MNASLPSRSSPAIGAVLDRLRDEASSLFGDSRVAFAVRRRMVRPFSEVVELQVSRGGHALTVFVKVLKPRAETAEEFASTAGNVRREFETLSRVRESLGDSHELSTVRPIAYYPELLALVTECLEGEPLNRTLSELRGVPSSRTLDRVADVLRKVAAWLRAFQAIEPPAGAVSLDRMHTYLDTRLRALVDLALITNEMRSGLLRFFDSRARDIVAAELSACPVHADFTPENVRVGAGRVGVLDFTMANRGSRYLDLAHMVMQIETLKARPWFLSSTLDRQIEVLISAYDRELRVDSALFQVLLLQHVVCFTLQSAGMNVTGLLARPLAKSVQRRHVNWLAARARVR